MVPSSRAKTRIKLLTATKRFMMISFISTQNFGLKPALSNRRDPVRLEVVNIQRTSHRILKLVIAGDYNERLRQLFNNIE
jgi:hypothetical protein